MLKTLILAAAVALPVAAPAAAAGDDTITMAVRTADLDLARSGDQQRLSRRIETAARSICFSGARDIASRIAESRCVEQALASAAPQAERAIALATSGRRLASIAVERSR